MERGSRERSRLAQAAIGRASLTDRSASKAPTGLLKIKSNRKRQSQEDEVTSLNAKIVVRLHREISGTWFAKDMPSSLCLKEKSYEYVDNISNGQVEEMDISFFGLKARLTY